MGDCCGNSSCWLCVTLFYIKAIYGFRCTALGCMGYIYRVGWYSGYWQKRKVENWVLLNVSNAFPVPLLFHKQLPLYAFLSNT